MQRHQVSWHPCSHLTGVCMFWKRLLEWLLTIPTLPADVTPLRSSGHKKFAGMRSLENLYVISGVAPPPWLGASEDYPLSELRLLQPGRKGFLLRRSRGRKVRWRFFQSWWVSSFPRVRETSTSIAHDTGDQPEIGSAGLGDKLNFDLKESTIEVVVITHLESLNDWEGGIHIERVFL